MPFPWKKVKNTKISQLVSEHLESQRRRGHLVVETGFPTSLVDLFVKNRDRLKKPKSSKKKKKAHNIDNSSPSPSSYPFHLPQGPSLSPFASPSISPSPSSLSLVSAPAVSSSLQAFESGVHRADGVDEEMDERPNAKGVVGAILRMFCVVVLALGAKRFAVGLTMSAFLLVLVEYVGKHLCRLLVPGSESKRKLKLMMQRILQVIGFRDKRLDEDNSCFTGIKGQLGASSEFNNHGGRNPICEIHQIGRSISGEDVQRVRKELGESSSGIKGQLGASSEFNNHGGRNSIGEIHQISRSISVEDIQRVRKEIEGSSSGINEQLRASSKFNNDGGRIPIGEIHQIGRSISVEDIQRLRKEIGESSSGIKGKLGASSKFNNHGGRNPSCEIHQIGRSISVEDIQRLRKEIGESSSGRSREFQFQKETGQPSCDGKSQLERWDSNMMVVEEKEVENGCDISEPKKGNNKKARMKLKMKHLLPRKLRGLKKEKRDSEREKSPIEEKTVVKLEEPEENEQGDTRNFECDSTLSLSLSRSLEGSDQINMISSSTFVGEENVEQIVIRQEQEKQRKGNSGYLVLCLIVLLGLVGGRMIAFTLMVLWFLILKSGEKLRRCVKLPVIRSLTKRSSYNLG